MTQKEWFKENILQSRTALAAGIALLLGGAAWVIWVPKDLAGWAALGTFLTAVLGGWVTGNKIQAKIDAGAPAGDGK